jgi:hypothetical protein
MIATMRKIWKLHPIYQSSIRCPNTKSITSAASSAARHLNILFPQHQSPNKFPSLVCGKTSLAARVDNCKEYPYGEEGSRLREFITKQLINAAKPQQGKLKKPLPKPDDKPCMKRGGERGIISMVIVLSAPET